ncbi:hypothetical protein Q7P35_000006 [Cladosporium inversicolor]
MSVGLPETVALHPAQGATPLTSRPRRNFKGTPVNLACNECRRRKVKCDGSRPVCQRCSSQDVDCIYSEPVDAHHTTLLKRKYDRLEEQSDDEHQLLELLRLACATDAMRILGCLRSGDDIQSVIDFARDLTLAGSAFSNTIVQDKNDEDKCLLVASGNTISAAITDVLPPGTRDPVAERYEQIDSVSVSQIDNVSLPSIDTLLSSIPIPNRRTRPTYERSDVLARPGQFSRTTELGLCAGALLDQDARPDILFEK